MDGHTGAGRRWTESRLQADSPSHQVTQGTPARAPAPLRRSVGGSAAMDELVGFHHVALTIRDLDASVSWYRDLLGFRELFREEGPDRRACVMKFASGYGVGLVEYPKVPFEAFDPTRA